MLLLAHGFSPSKGGVKFLAASGAAAISYFVFNPYLLFNLSEVWGEAKIWQSQYQTGWKNFGYGPLFALTHLLPYGFGSGLIFWGIAASLFAFFSKRREVWLLLAGLFLFFYLTARTGTTVIKYYIVLIPFLTLLIAHFFKSLMQNASWGLRVLSLAAFIWMVVDTSGLSFSYDYLFLQTDARDKASKWIQEHIPQGAKIAVFTEPYYHSPPVIYNQYFFSGRSPWWRVEHRYEILNLDGHDLKLREENPDYVIVSGRENLRFRRGKGDYRTVHDWSQLESFLKEEGGGYVKVQQFENQLRKYGWSLPSGFPPDDWLQILAEVRIYQSQKIS